MPFLPTVASRFMLESVKRDFSISVSESPARQGKRGCKSHQPLCKGRPSNILNEESVVSVQHRAPLLRAKLSVSADICQFPS
jgi:hypothetical protein